MKMERWNDGIMWKSDGKKKHTFGNANMIIVFEKRGLISETVRDDLLRDLEQECKMITPFSRTLRP
jgi:hypothetical protein